MYRISYWRSLHAPNSASFVRRNNHSLACSRWLCASVFLSIGRRSILISRKPMARFHVIWPYKATRSSAASGRPSLSAMGILFLVDYILSAFMKPTGQICCTTLVYGSYAPAHRMNFAPHEAITATRVRRNVACRGMADSH